MNLSAGPDNIFLLEQLAEHSDNAFFLFDVKHGRFNYISPAFEAIWECPRRAIEQSFSPVLDTVLPTDRQFVLRSWNWYRRPARSNHKTFEFRLAFPDGRLKWLFAELFLLRNDDNSFCIAGWARDISDRKNYLEVLRKYASRKNSILEVLTHDMSGFLALLNSLSSGVLEDVKNANSDDVVNKLEIIRQTCLRSAELITDLVNREFIESAGVKFNRQRLDLVVKIGDIIASFRAAQEEMGKTFLLESNAPQIFAEVDDVKFMQVINNLISNAIKFTPNGGTIRVWLTERPETVLIQISDNGIGIPEELQPILFNRFTEARRPGLRGEPSIGLGMSIIHRIVDMHGGRIWFNSRENEGTTFFIELPKY